MVCTGGAEIWLFPGGGVLGGFSPRMCREQAPHTSAPRRGGKTSLPPRRRQTFLLPRRATPRGQTSLHPRCGETSIPPLQLYCWSRIGLLTLLLLLFFMSLLIDIMQCAIFSF